MTFYEANDILRDFSRGKKVSEAKLKEVATAFNIVKEWGACAECGNRLVCLMCPSVPPMVKNCNFFKSK